MSFCVYLVIDSSISKNIRNQLPLELYLYCGKHATENLLYSVGKVNLIGLIIKQNILIKINQDDKIKFVSATQYEMCNHKFPLLFLNIRNHCNLVGKLHAALCSLYNLKIQEQNYPNFYTW